MLGIDFFNGFSLRPYRERNDRLSSFCPWSYPVGKENEGIILLKPGALMRAYSFVCPDLGSSSAESIQSVSFFFNEALRQLGNDWGCQFESQRVLCADYPGTDWEDEAGYLIDRHRQRLFQEKDAHFLNYYFLILTKNLPSEIYSRAKGFLYKKESEEGEGWFNLEACEKEIQAFRDTTSGIMSHLTGRISFRMLGNDEVATLCHNSVSSRHHKVTCPKNPTLFDYYITDDNLKIASTLQLGDTYIPIVAVREFPMQTRPDILGVLNSSQIEYRWSSRWIGRDKADSAKDIEKYQKRFYGSRKSWGTALAETMGNFESGREDPAASAFESDTNAAKVELSTDVYSFGYYTSCVMVWDTDYGVALEKARYIISLINSTGFTAKLETVNSFNAFLGMQPGNMYANVRRPVISSGNMSHIVPLSSIWSGAKFNRWTKECFGCFAPLLTCSTSSGVPFFLNLNVGDVGHCFVFGPSGAGKSTLLSLLANQFKKYRNANVVFLDKDKTSRSVTMAAGGMYVEPGANDVAFQPLRELEGEVDLSWASEFIKLLLEMQGIKADAVMSEAISVALRQIRDEKEPCDRTLTTFQQYVNYTNPLTGQNDIRTGIQPYTINGEYGRIFDASDTNLSLSKWIMIEMGTLMKMGQQAVTPALFFIFHFIEKVWSKPNGDPTGDPTLLILDEAWVFLDNPFFARKIEEWLVTLRKKHVFCVFATQEVAKACKSSLATTIISQCLTKIYLADKNASSAVIADYYRFFGLEDNEISALSRARMKNDYFYKSPNGARMFELALDGYQLALLTPDHDLLDSLEREYGKNSGIPLVEEILGRKGITEYREYLKS